MSLFHLYVNYIDVTTLAGDIQWSSDVDTLAQSLTFSLPFDKDGLHFPRPFIEVGHTVRLRHESGQDIFFGIVVDENRSGRGPITYNCFDFAFYLNENKTTIQFNNLSAKQAIEKLCDKFNIRYNVANLNVKIDKIYKSQTVSEIIKDILKICSEQTGIRYRFEMRIDTLVVFHWKDIRIDTNVEWISNPNRKVSLSGLKNRIEVVSDNEKAIRAFGSAQDSASIAKYGLLTESHVISEKEISKAQQVANNLLRELNKLQEDNSLSLIGDYRVRAGRLIAINEPITGIVGEFLIKSARHTYNNGIHLMDLGLVVE